MSPCRVLLVGAGNIARTVHMPTFLELPSDFTVVGAVDADPTAARAFAADFALPHHSTDLAEANHVTPARLEKLLALADGMSLPCVGFDELP
ncbi:Gfo/Idh/MocA family oxidoreductase [Streptomyces atratus]|uniref:Gfo/Idh/MocA family oxidoreductase n=1 Tax=Streptomyces atratus TaxID=1893 RepID=UPI00366381B8